MALRRQALVSDSIEDRLAGDGLDLLGHLALLLVHPARATQSMLERRRRIILGRPAIGILHVGAEARYVEIFRQIRYRPNKFRGGFGRRRWLGREAGSSRERGLRFGGHHGFGLGLVDHRRLGGGFRLGDGLLLLPFGFLDLLRPTPATAADRQSGTGEHE